MELVSEKLSGESLAVSVIKFFETFSDILILLYTHVNIKYNIIVNGFLIVVKKFEYVFSLSIINSPKSMILK